MENKINSKADFYGKIKTGEAIPLALQHIFAMVVANMLPALLISSIAGLTETETTMLIQGTMLAAGIATFMQLFAIKINKNLAIGGSLPVIMGMSYVFLGACLDVVAKHGIATMIGAQIIGSLFMIPMALIVERLSKYFTTLVSGVVVFTMGLGLFSVAISNFAGGTGNPEFGSPKYLIIGSIVALSILLLTYYGKGIVKDIAVLIGIGIGYIISLPFGMVDFSQVFASNIIDIPKPLYFGIEFNPSVILTFIVLFTIQVADLMGMVAMVTTGGLQRNPSNKDYSSTILGVSVSGVIASLLNVMPAAIFSQNAAIVTINKVVNRKVFAIGAFILVLAGFFPTISAVLTTIPAAVLGGATLVIFANILISGISILSIDFSEKNRLIAGVAIAFSIGIQMVPDFTSQLPSMMQTLFGSNVATAAIIALILQGILRDKDNEIEE